MQQSEKEYVKCGNYYCNRCPHGPYYYAYWRDPDDNNKVKKKYMGKYDPREDKKTMIKLLANKQL